MGLMWVVGLDELQKVAFSGSISVIFGLVKCSRVQSYNVDQTHVVYLYKTLPDVVRIKEGRDGTK